MAKKHGRARSTASRIGRGLMSNLKPRGMSAGIGAAARFAQDMGEESVDFLKKNWYGSPLAFLAASLVVKNERIGSALATIAGYSGAFNYKLNEFQAGRSKTSPVPLFEQKVAGETKGLPNGGGDAGLLNEPRAGADAGLLFETSATSN